MATWADVSRIALSLPESVESDMRGNRAWKVGGKLFVWERPLRGSDLKALGASAPTGPILGARVEHLIAKEALIADDPDAPAGTWVHWVLYNLPATTAELPENVAKVETLDLGGAHQGRNDFQRSGYGGPCPPPGPAHRYVFKLYALDARLQLRPAAQKKDVEAAMQGHTLGMAQLLGTYARRKR